MAPARSRSAITGFSLARAPALRNFPVLCGMPSALSKARAKSSSVGLDSAQSNLTLGFARSAVGAGAPTPRYGTPFVGLKESGDEGIAPGSSLQQPDPLEESRL